MMFRKLKALADYERQHLTSLSSVDRWLVIEIGAAEESGLPLSSKQLVLLDIAPQATVRRRLKHLLDVDLISQRQVVRDKRVNSLHVTAKTHRIFKGYEAVLCSDYSLRK